MTLAFYRFSDIPVEIMAYLHYRHYTEMGIGSYLYRVEVEALSHSVLIIALDLSVALIFLRCGSPVVRFLLGENTDFFVALKPHANPEMQRQEAKATADPPPPAKG